MPCCKVSRPNVLKFQMFSSNSAQTNSLWFFANCHAMKGLAVGEQISDETCSSISFYQYWNDVKTQSLQRMRGYVVWFTAHIHKPQGETNYFDAVKNQDKSKIDYTCRKVQRRTAKKLIVAVVVAYRFQNGCWPWFSSYCPRRRLTSLQAVQCHFLLIW